MWRDWVSRRFGPRSRRLAREDRPRRARSLRTEMDCLEGRALLSATSAVAWTTGGVTHSALYAIDQNDNVEVSVDGGSFTNLGGPLAGPAKQVSAGLDVFNKPEVYAIGPDNAVWLNKGSGWVSLGGYAKAISATIENAIYAIGTDDQLYLSYGVASYGWVKLGSPASGVVSRKVRTCWRSALSSARSTMRHSASPSSATSNVVQARSLALRNASGSRRLWSVKRSARKLPTFSTPAPFAATTPGIAAYHH